MKILYVTDLDGTLLNSQVTVSQNSIEIINALVEQGMLFTYATARSLVSASKVTKGLSTKIPVIAYNGTFIFDAKAGQILFSEQFLKDEILNIRHILEEYQLSPMVYSYIGGKESLSWIQGVENEETLKYLGKRKNDKRLRPVDNIEDLYAGDVFYFTCIGKKEDFERRRKKGKDFCIYEEMAKADLEFQICSVYECIRKDQRYTCTLQPEPNNPKEYWLEIMPRNATKANAILKLKKMWNCDRVVAFGDGANDIPMFRISDECYAMENAVNALKEIATGVIGSNDADGVAEWLKKHIEIS